MLKDSAVNVDKIKNSLCILCYYLKSWNFAGNGTISAKLNGKTVRNMRISRNIQTSKDLCYPYQSIFWQEWDNCAVEIFGLVI